MTSSTAVAIIRDKWNTRRDPGPAGVFLISLVAVLLTSAIFYEHTISYTAYYALALGGVLSIGCGSARGLSREEWALVATTSSVIFASWLSYAYSGFAPAGWERFQEAQTPLLGIIPIFLFARHLGMTPAIWVAAAAGATACGLMILVEISTHFHSPVLAAISQSWSSGYRVSAGEHPLPLAFTSLIFIAIVAVGWRWFARFGVLGWLLWSSSILFGGLALMLSGTRGAWIAVPVFLVVYLALRWRRLGTGWKFSSVACLILIPVIALQSPPIQKRFEEAESDVVTYINRTGAQDVESSVGLRFDTFKAAWEAFRERPILGYGPGGWEEAFSDAKKKGVSEGRLLPNPHNMYLSSLALRGLVGFTTEMAFLCLFAYLFGRRVREARGGVIEDLAMAGLIVTVAIFVMGLTWVPLGWWRKQTILLGFLLVGIFGAIRFLERRGIGQEPRPVPPVAPQ